LRLAGADMSLEHEEEHGGQDRARCQTRSDAFAIAPAGLYVNLPNCGRAKTGRKTLAQLAY